MSEAVENTVEYTIDVATPEKAPLTPEQKMEFVKQELLNELVSHHNPYHAFVLKLPINDDMKKFALVNLIHALHLIEDGVRSLQFEVVESPAPQENIESPTEGVTL